MSEPTLIPRDALSGQKIALSVSESADLARLGLTEQHCRLMVAEVGRAIMLAGATVVYGGNLVRDGYTHILIEEAQRFSNGRQALEIVLAESEYRLLGEGELLDADRSLGDFGRFTLVSASGASMPISDTQVGSWAGGSSEALTAMRKYTAAQTDARLVVGGRLVDYAGAEPGIVEEARLTIETGRTLLAAGGYGGAAAAVARRLRPEDFDAWVPDNYPAHGDDAGVLAALERLEATLSDNPPAQELDEVLLRNLSISHRPADVATATVRLLSQITER